MNALTLIPAQKVDSATQSLTAVCRARRWDLLQQFALLEIALKQKLDTPPRMFGKKVRAWIEVDPSAKRFERLIDARTLVAHAHVSPVQIGGVAYVQWEIADGANELNCAKFNKLEFKEWTKGLETLLGEAIAAATLIAASRTPNP